MEAHLDDSPEKNEDHEWRSSPTENAESSNTKNGWNHHQDTTCKGEKRKRKMHAEIELNCAGKKSGLNPEPADQ